jgi:DNA primase
VANIPDDKVQEVRDKVDIIDLVGRYVELRKAGRNFKGLCPFHQERTPSFNVNPQRKGYKCFGCGAGGDGIRFVMEIEGKSFPEAVRKLAEQYGVHLPAEAMRGGSRGPSPHEKDAAYAVTKAACELYESLLADKERGRTGQAYLERRGLTPELAGRFRLGYAPAPAEAGWDTLCAHLKRQGLSLDTAQKLGLVGKSERTGNLYDKFRGRLMFPVIQPGGEIVAFSGRVVPPHDEDDRGGNPPPKYVNSSESLLFTKSKQLFGLATARAAIRSSKRAILVEGNVDVAKLHQWGHEEAVAPLGTALTPEQARLLGRFAEQVIMCFDGDKAGKKAAWAALPHLIDADLDVRMVLLPDGEDPDSIGEERFGALLRGCRPALEEMMLRVAAKAGDAAHARGKALDRMLPLIARVQSDSARQLYAHRAGELFQLPVERIEHALSGLRRGGGRPDGPQENSRQKPSTSNTHVPLSAAVRPLPPLPAGQSRLAMLLVDVPHLASVAERTGATECITDDRLQPVVRAVIDGAKEGRDPDLQDLLTEVDPSAHRLIYDSVFAGEYRGLSDQGADPQVVLASLVRACRSETLERRIIDIKNQMRDAQAGGFPDRARELAQVWMELRREQERLLKASGPLAERSPSDSRPQEAAAPVPDPGPGANGADEAPGGLPN